MSVQSDSYDIQEEYSTLWECFKRFFEVIIQDDVHNLRDEHIEGEPKSDRYEGKFTILTKDVVNATGGCYTIGVF